MDKTLKLDMKGEEKIVVKLATATHKAFDTRIFHKEARTLAEAGYRVSIIVPHEKDETKFGVEICAVRLPKNGKEQKLITPFLILFKALKQSKNAVYHIHDSGLLLIGVVLKIFGRKVIYDAHEDTPLQISYQQWVPKLIKKPYIFYYKVLEWFCGKIFDALIVAEPVIAKYFPTSKTYLIRNFPLLTTFENHTYIPYEKRNKTVVYVGLISVPRGIKEMVNASNLANKRKEFTFLLGGIFSPKSLENEILDAKSNIEYVGWLSLNQVIDSMLSSKIGLITPHPNERYKTNYPVKMFEYMAAGLPVIVSKMGLSADFVKESNCGILVNPLDEKEIADAIIYLLENPLEAKAMGERGKAMVYDKYSWEQENLVLLEVYDKLFTS